MIPVVQAAEPKNFDAEVRQRGLGWLREHGVVLDQPPPDPAVLPTFWRMTNHDLWRAYNGICAYLSIYFAWPLGASSTDHFVAKSSNAGLAYEWSNYRLSCLGMNRHKNRFDDVIDPFEMDTNTFLLDLLSGEMTVNPALDAIAAERARTTIERLQLNAPDTKEMRASHFLDYHSGDTSERYFREHSPFVWSEAHRQGML